MKLHHLISSLFGATIFLLFTQCEKVPVEEPISDAIAIFYLNADEIVLDDTVKITNGSKNATTYAWDFGDSTTSDVENPTHLYTSAGEYSITLSAKNSQGKISEFTRVIQVNENPPVSMLIHKIELHAWPLTNQGLEWDRAGYPDISPEIDDAFGRILKRGCTHDNCISGNTYVFDCSDQFPVKTNNIYITPTTINWIDMDYLGPDDHMGNYSFTAYKVHEIGLNKIHISNGDWEYDLFVSWIY